MGLIDRAARDAHIMLERDAPVKHQRRVRDWARLIGVARKLEAQDFEQIEEERRRYSRLLAQMSDLQAKNFELLQRLQRFELLERMEKMELPERDQKLLLGETAESDLEAVSG